MLSTGKAAKLIGVHAQTLRKWERDGKITPQRTESGQRRYNINDIKQFFGKDVRRRIIYCRVSSKKQEEDLQRQILYIKEQFPDHEVISDISSGIHYNRPGFKTLLEHIMLGDVGEVVCSYRDRIGRFGLSMFEQVCEFYKTKIRCINEEDEGNSNSIEGVAEDIVAIITSYSAKIHGMRKYRIDKDE